MYDRPWEIGRKCSNGKGTKEEGGGKEEREKDKCGNSFCKQKRKRIEGRGD